MFTVLVSLEKNESLGTLSSSEIEDSPSERSEVGNGGARIEDFKWGFEVLTGAAAAK